MNKSDKALLIPTVWVEPRKTMKTITTVATSYDGEKLPISFDDEPAKTGSRPLTDKRRKEISAAILVNTKSY
jgi:hypothetical protein